MLWSKLDADILKSHTEKFDKVRKVMGRDPKYADNVTFGKFSEHITNFKESIPLI